MTEAAPTNITGSGISNWDPILISLVRRAMPNLIAYDIAGVQPMTGPTGLIFTNEKQIYFTNRKRSLFDEADTDFSARNAASIQQQVKKLAQQEVKLEDTLVLTLRY